MMGDAALTVFLGGHSEESAVWEGPLAQELRPVFEIVKAAKRSP